MSRGPMGKIPFFIVPSGVDRSGGDAGLSGGAVAGIVLGALAIVAITGVAVLFLRGRASLPSRQAFASGSSGFDNALYSKAPDTADGSVKGSVSFGSEASQSES